MREGEGRGRRCPLLIKENHWCISSYRQSFLLWSLSRRSCSGFEWYIYCMRRGTVAGDHNSLNLTAHSLTHSLTMTHCTHTLAHSLITHSLTALTHPHYTTRTFTQSQSISLTLSLTNSISLTQTTLNSTQSSLIHSLILIHSHSIL